VVGFGISIVETLYSGMGELDGSWGNRSRGWEVDRTGSGLCLVVDFGISGIELFYSGTGELVN